VPAALGGGYLHDGLKGGTQINPKPPVAKKLEKGCLKRLNGSPKTPSNVGAANDLLLTLRWKGPSKGKKKKKKIGGQDQRVGKNLFTKNHYKKGERDASGKKGEGFVHLKKKKTSVKKSQLPRTEG